MSCETPVVFIVFRRPCVTEKVFERIREAKPKKLFVIADGARTQEEEGICKQTRDITERVDWNCEVFRDYASKNMGARERISSGIDWVFEHVEDAIILEDDCLADPSFFEFCTELLKRFRNDERIFHISGDNFQHGEKRGEGSYYFSNYNHAWGWATWRRAWKHYDHDMKGWPEFRDGNYLEGLLDNPFEIKYWSDIFERLYSENKPDAWDYIWTMSCWMQYGLSILPNVNLVENIGIGPRADATNTAKVCKWVADRPAESMVDKLVHPSFVVRDRTADELTFENVYPGRKMHLDADKRYQLRRKLWHIKTAAASILPFIELG